MLKRVVLQRILHLQRVSELINSVINSSPPAGQVQHGGSPNRDARHFLLSLTTLSLH